MKFLHDTYDLESKLNFLVFKFDKHESIDSFEDYYKIDILIYN